MDNLWSCFAETAKRQGAADALVLPDATLSFTALHRLAEDISAFLAAQGVSAGQVVALHLPKEAATYGLLLACLRLGAPYVFIDPKNPPDRTRRILDRVRPGLLFTRSDIRNPHGNTLQAPLPGAAAAMPPPATVTGSDPAYIMFTSGSTGEPKGAVIPHRGIFELMAWARQDILGDAPQRFTGINPLHFDNSVFDIYCGLLNGAALVPIETGATGNPATWARLAQQGGATVMFAVPTLFMILDSLGLLTPKALPTIRTFIFGGEGYPAPRLQAFLRRFEGHARLVNVYGPTETSCICSSITVEESLIEEAGGKFISLGRMHDGFRHAIRDTEGREAPRGEAGELWIGGPCVGLGYYRAPEESRQRFVPHGPDQSLWYRTGDLVREDSQGRLHFQGRADNQVKIRGHRIELEEIDSVIEGTENVRRAVTVALAMGDETELHVAFEATGAVEKAALAGRCRDTLPTYMRPSAFIRLEKLPLNANGKVDRLATRAILLQFPAPIA